MVTFYLSLSLSIALLALPLTVLAQTLVIGVSPYQEQAAANTQIKSILQFLATTVKPGESCLLFDAYNIQSLGTFTVPSKAVYRHPKAKLQANPTVVAKLLAFAKQARKPQGSNEPSIRGAIRLPQALRFVGENYPVAKGSDLIILGSPLYDDPKEKDFSMTRNHIPGDGHLTKARSMTPYGIKGQESLLTQWRVHVGFPDDSWKQDDHHAFYVKRWWTLFIEGQGGALSTFSSDWPTLQQRVERHALSPKHAFQLEPSDKLEMILLRPPVVKQQTSIYERPLSMVPLALELVRQAPNVEIGLTWKCGECDLDLYARNGLGSEPLSFRNTQTPEGTYFKDWTRSPRLTNGYETVAYHVPVDLEHLFLAINFYGGKISHGVKGELRISLDGQTYAKSFHILASEGNGGDKREETVGTGKAVSPHWLVINPLTVIGERKNVSILTKK